MFLCFLWSCSSYIHLLWTLYQNYTVSLDTSLFSLYFFSLICETFLQTMIYLLSSLVSLKWSTTKADVLLGLKGIFKLKNLNILFFFINMHVCLWVWLGTYIHIWICMYVSVYKCIYMYKCNTICSAVMGLSFLLCTLMTHIWLWSFILLTKYLRAQLWCGIPFTWIF